MLKFLRLVLALVVGVVLIVFAVANRQVIDIHFAPLPLTLDLPLYAVALIFLILGALIGGSAAWLNQLPRRFHARKEHRKLTAIETQQAKERADEEARQVAAAKARRAQMGTPGQSTVLVPSGRA
ncbi:lipopolysaccharide assembly protein LapA domain-containing protein [Marinivivus vitaminiproducens]|uniref:lipopolysaccharide assembly protein LapA domain-containing protein n=1 Tax=Marinivivus vitaminiproducens TaxID=3035935 RepID=UPI0027A10A53|nr:lipopolysaccharide assembly protein LapA domain-containing protein [Geminicoccaceae bacterium SCSIO 64248]